MPMKFELKNKRLKLNRDIIKKAITKPNLLNYKIKKERQILCLKKLILIRF